MTREFLFGFSDRETALWVGIYALLVLVFIYLELASQARGTHRIATELQRRNEHLEDRRDQDEDDEYEKPEWYRSRWV